MCVIFPAADPLVSSEGSLLTIMFVSFVLLLLLLVFGKVYRKYYISLFEVVSLVNLILLAVLSLYYSSIGGRQEIAVYVSAGIFLTCFSFAIGFHFYVTRVQRFLTCCRNGRDGFVPIDGRLSDLIIDDRS